MENAQNTVQGSPATGSSLAAAVERLDSVLSALESRVRDLKARSEGTGSDSLTGQDARQLQDEIDSLKAREKVLEDAASGAFEALGLAAKDIRQLLSEQAA